MTAGEVVSVGHMENAFLEEFEEATRMFQQALSHPEATLESNDGPRVAPLAERRLREIGQ